MEASTVTFFRSRSHRKCRPCVSLCSSPSASVLNISPLSVSFQEICSTLFCVQGAHHACPRPGGDCPHRGSGPWFPRALLPLWGQWHPKNQSNSKTWRPWCLTKTLALTDRIQLWHRQLTQWHHTGHPTPHSPSLCTNASNSYPSRCSCETKTQNCKLLQ